MSSEERVHIRKCISGLVVFQTLLCLASVVDGAISWIGGDAARVTGDVAGLCYYAAIGVALLWLRYTGRHRRWW